MSNSTVATTVGILFKLEGFKEPLDLAHFIEKHWESDYWQNCYTFVEENWDVELNALTERQNKWVNKIVDDVVDKRLSR